jgi:hypothetical protein
MGAVMTNGATVAVTVVEPTDTHSQLVRHDTPLAVVWVAPAAPVGVVVAVDQVAPFHTSASGAGDVPVATSV